MRERERERQTCELFLDYKQLIRHRLNNSRAFYYENKKIHYQASVDITDNNDNKQSGHIEQHKLKIARKIKSKIS